MVHEEAALSQEDRARLAELHQQALSGAMFSRLGLGVLRRYYRFVEVSADETLFIQRHEGAIAAAAVLSLAGPTLLRRFVVRYPVRFVASVLIALLTNGSFRSQLSSYLGERFADTYEEEQLPEVLQIYADPQFRGGGIGTRLMRVIERALAETGEGVLSVRTQARDNEPTLRFYRRLGYDPFRHSVFCGEKYVCLRKTLNAR